MTTCPLPIDWLDLLAGRPSAASRSHLDHCPSCRAVVESLDDADLGSPSLAALSELATQIRHDVTLAGSSSDELPSMGEIWWLAVDDDIPVTPLVLLLDRTDEYAEPVFDIAPLWIDD